MDVCNRCNVFEYKLLWDISLNSQIFKNRFFSNRNDFNYFFKNPAFLLSSAWNHLSRRSRERVSLMLWCMKGWTWFTRNNPAVINIIWKIAWQYLQFRSTDVILTAMNMHSWVKEGNLIYLNLYWIHIRKILN